LRTGAAQVVAKANTESRDHDDAHAVDAVVDPRKATSQNSFVVSEEAAEEAAAEGRIPSDRNARREVVPVGIVGVLAPEFLDGHVVELRVIELPRESHGLARGDVVVEVDELAGGVIDDDSLLAAGLIGWQLDSPVEA